MPLICLHERGEIAAFLRRNSPLQIYSLGDLDDFFWPYTTWYAHKESGQVQALLLVYSGVTPPVMLAISEEPLAPLAGLLRTAHPFLPRQVYAHLSGNLSQIFAGTDQILSHGLHEKMHLVCPERLGQFDSAGAISLSTSDRADLERLYAESYPDNAFDPRMLETGCYYGIRQEGRLVCAAGVHVYSPSFGVAALGNIVTHPAVRGQGLAQTVTARLCRELLQRVEVIGLNVKASNAPAIAVYQKLGFVKVGEYGEYTITLA